MSKYHKLELLTYVLGFFCWGLAGLFINSVPFIILIVLGVILVIIGFKFSRHPMR